MPDRFEDEKGLNKFDINDGLHDKDMDWLPNYYEYIFDIPGIDDTDIDNPDTDGNGIMDGWEDFDSDGMPNGWEIDYGLNLTNGTDASGDLDSDGVTNLQEYINGTDPTKAPFSQIISPVANVPEEIDAQAEAETTIELTALESLPSVSVNVTKYDNISKNPDVSPLTTSYGLAESHQSIGKGIVIKADESLRQNLSSVMIRVYYTDSELDRTGDGDADDVGDIDPTDAWQALEQGEIVCGTETIQIFDNGVDTTDNFVYAEISSLSVFGLVGTLTELVEPIITGGGGGPPAPTPPPALPQVFKPEVTRLTDQLIIDLFLKGDWANRDFWTVPISVAPSLVLTDELPSPISPLVRGLLVKPVKMLLEPLKVFRGESVKSKEAINDIYRFTTEKVLNKYQQSDVVVIAVREPAVDSMAAVAFAKSQDAPILLTEQDEAPEITIDAVRKLNPQRIVIVGGTVAISSAVEAEFEKIAPTERIWGPTRYETAVELAERLDPDMVVITDGENPYQDAVLVAAEYKAPIIYVRGKEIPDSTRDFLVKHIKTQEGNQMSWVTAGVDEDVHTEIQGIYTLPDFLTRNRLSLKLFQFGTRFLR
jgi:AmiR/NasT family two-component response regulator